MLTLLFVGILQDILPLPFTNLADEIILLISIVVIFLYSVFHLKKLKIKYISFILLLYMIYCLVNYLYSPFKNNPFMMGFQLLVNIKLFVCSIGFILLYDHLNINNRSAKYLFSFLTVAFFVCLFLNLVLQENWNYLLDLRIVHRDGLLRLNSFFNQTGAAANFSVTTFITYFLLKNEEFVKKSPIKTFIIILFASSVFLYLFGARKILLMLIPFFIMLKKISNNRVLNIGLNFFALILIIVFILLIKYGSNLVIVSDLIYSVENITSSDHHYIRGLIIFYAVVLAGEMFPFGTSPGTFGTIGSEHYLDVYHHVGLKLGWLANTEIGGLQGIQDAVIFSLLAENGVLGMIIIGALLYYFFSFMQKNLNNNYCYMVFKAITYFALIASCFGPFMQSGFGVSVFLLNLIFIKYYANRNNSMNV